MNTCQICGGVSLTPICPECDFPTCQGQWCENAAGPSGFCRLCEPILVKPEPPPPVDMTTCPAPCGRPAVRDGLCAAHDARERPKARVNGQGWRLTRVRR